MGMCTPYGARVVLNSLNIKSNNAYTLACEKSAAPNLGMAPPSYYSKDNFLIVCNSFNSKKGIILLAKSFLF